MFRPTRIIPFLLLLAVFPLIPSPTPAQQPRGPSTPEERARALQAAKLLRIDPLSAATTEEREWLIKWLIQVPDISVKLCPSLLGDLGDSKAGNPGAIISSMMASQAAFVIEHPDKVKNREALYFAGADGALQSYQAIRQQDPSYHIPHLDQLILQRDQGKLTDYVHSATKKCK
jgi:hypothetical protein